MTLLLSHLPLIASLGNVNMVTMLLVMLVVVAFIVVFITNKIIVGRVKKTTAQTEAVTSIMHHALSLGNIHVLRFKMSTRQVRCLHGTLLKEKHMALDDFVSLIHPDDRIPFEILLEQQSHKGGDNATCEIRIKDSNGEWRNMSCQAVVEGSAQPTNIICTLTDETEAVKDRMQEQELTEKYKRIFNQSIVGLAFYDQDGMLIAANSTIRDMHHFQGEYDPFYYKTCIYDIPLFRDIIDRQHVEDLYFCTRQVVLERGVNIYVEVRLHPTYDDIGQLVNISVVMSDVTDERALYLKIKEKDADIMRANERIRGYESELQYLMDNCDMRVWRTSFAKREIAFFKSLEIPEQKLSFDAFQTYFIDEDGTIARNFDAPEKYFTEPVSYLCHMHPIFHTSRDMEWNMIDCVPVFDKQGNLEGCFGTIRNVTSLMEAQERLKEETRRANDSGRQKSVFMANMTHEIRTPLNSIVGFSDLLPMMSTQEEKREIVRVIMNNCDMLLRLIDGILEISTIEGGDVLIENSPVDFAQAFAEMSAELSARVEAPTVQFIAENPFASLTASVDVQRVKQVLTNFVTNAVKYTNEGHIRVGYRLTPDPTLNGAGDTSDGLYIYCEDTGLGIPKDKQAAVFERFVKLNDYVQGTGLGLSICKAIVRRMGGYIGVESEGEGSGSTFWIWIPRN